jgi:transcription factor C subunit 3
LLGGSLAFRRKKIIFDILDKCGGVFPADRSLWLAWAAVWMKENPGSGKPDYQTLKKVQKALVDSGNAKLLRFNFTTTKGAQCSRSLILGLETELDSPVVKNMQSKIIKQDGDIYLPPEVEIPAGIRRTLESRSDLFPKVIPIQEKVEVPRLFLPDGVLQRLQEKQERTEIRKLERERKNRERRIERMEYEQLRDARKRMKRAATAARLGRRGFRPDEALDMIYSGTSRVSRLHGSGQPKPLLWQETLVPESYDPQYNVMQQYTTLTAPTQTFHRPSGTFGTDFLVTVRQPARLVMSIPETLDDIISHAKGRRPNPQRRYRDFMRTKFEYEVNEVMRWEERGNGVHFRTPDTRFINHMVPAIAAVPDQAPGLIISLDRGELYTLDQPPDLDVPTDDEGPKPREGRAIKGGRKSFRTHPTKLYKTRKLTAMEATPIGQGSEVEYQHGSGESNSQLLHRI